MRVLDVETIRRRLADRKIALVARKTGINPNTLYRILSGKRNPRYDTLCRLSEYLTAESDEDNLTNKTRRYHEKLQVWPYTRPGRNPLFDG